MTIEAELSDGRILEFPDGTDTTVIQATVKRMLGTKTDAPSTQTEGWGAYTPSGERPQPTAPMFSQIASGAIRGAGSIGSTLLWPSDKLTGQSNEERRAKITQQLIEWGADPESASFQAGKLLTELAGTAGTGGLLAKGAGAVGTTPRVVEALKSWGMNTGTVTKGIGQKAADLAIRVPAGATVGGAAGLAIDPEHSQVGAGMGAASAAVLPAITNPLMRLGHYIKGAVRPSSGELGVRAAGAKADDVYKALLTERSSVPGVQWNAGQASVPANSAEFAALQKLTAERHSPSLYFGPAGVKGQQETARGAAVEGFAKTPQDLEAAISARTAVSKANYSEAFDVVVKRDKGLRELWKNPYFRDELGEAVKLFRASNAQRKLQGLPPKKLRDDMTALLHSVKEGLDARLQTATRPDAPAISNASKKAIVDVKDNLVTWLGTKNPAYDEARLAHKAASVPINQMKAGQPMQRALVAPGTGKERSASFSNAVRSAETKMSKTTGRAQIEALTPEQRSVIQSINRDFARNAQYGELSSKGMESLKELVGATQSPPTGFFQPMVSAARSWLNKLLGTGHEMAMDKLGPLMRDPQAYAALMHAALPAQRKALVAIIDRYMSAAGVVASQDETLDSIAGGASP